MCLWCFLIDKTGRLKLMFHVVEQEVPQEAGAVCFGGLTLQLFQKAIPSCFVYRSEPINQQEVTGMIHWCGAALGCHQRLSARVCK